VLNSATNPRRVRADRLEAQWLIHPAGIAIATAVSWVVFSPRPLRVVNDNVVSRPGRLANSVVPHDHGGTA